MGNSGVGMLLGDTSASMLWLLLLGAAILGLIVLYVMTRSGRLSQREWREIEKNTETAQRRDDPPKHL